MKSASKVFTKGKSQYLLVWIAIPVVFLTLVILNPRAMAATPNCSPPPFWSAPTTPNVLMILDVSGSMQCSPYLPYYFQGYNSNGSAYCTPNNADSDDYPQSAYSIHRSYYGYFDSAKFYKYDPNAFSDDLSDPGGFVEVDPSTCSQVSGQNVCSEDRTVTCTSDSDCIGKGSCIDAIGGPDCISGNLLNWATMTREDILRKALIGGKHIAVTSNGDFILRSEGGRWDYTDKNLKCEISVSGGSLPYLDHTLTISDYGGTSIGTCGYLTVKATGFHIWGYSDDFFYVYQRLTGDFDVRLKVVNPPNTAYWAKTGLMARASLSSYSRQVMISATNHDGSQTIQFFKREYDGGGTNYIDYKTGYSLPVWLRLVRHGQTFQGYYSYDGSTWTAFSSYTYTSPNEMPNTIYLGIATASYSSSYGIAELDEFVCESGEGCSSDDFNDGSFDTTIWSTASVGDGDGEAIESCNTGCVVGTLTQAKIRLAVPQDERRGVLQKVLDKDKDGNTDPGSPRVGIEVFSSGYGTADREGCLRVGVTNSTLADLISAVENEPPYGGTPTRYALDEALDYFTQQNNYDYCNSNNRQYIGGIGSSLDPWYEPDPFNPGRYIGIPCRKSYIVTISDGEWNTGGDPLSITRSSHIDDLRSDLSGEQNFIHYTLFTFSTGSGGKNSLQNMAMYGGFSDLDGNSWPFDVTSYPSDSRSVGPLDLVPQCSPSNSTLPEGCKEWDKNGDGIPDKYFEASNGEELEQALTQIFEEISPTGSAGAVATVTQEIVGEDVIVRGAFDNKPNERIIWRGHLESYWPDPEGCSGYNQRTCEGITGCQWLNNRCSGTIYSFQKPENEGKFCSYPTFVGGHCLDSGEKLKNQPQRTIYTYLDNQIKFSDSTNFNTIKDYLDLDASSDFNGDGEVNDTDKRLLINWVIGSEDGDGTHMRNRNDWLLGDIVYSTPVVVGAPSLASVPRELAGQNCNCTCILGVNNDCAKRCFYCYRYQKLHRKKVVYVGANDGMLHAFVVGKWVEGDNPDTSAVENGYWTYDPDKDSEIGTELWAYIPSNLLSELKYLAKPNYGSEGGCQHRTMVDLSPSAWDVYIDHDGDGNKEWRTVIIGGERGGGDVYFAIDVTDPDSPQILWEYSVIRNMLVYKSGTYEFPFTYQDYLELKNLPLSWTTPYVKPFKFPEDMSNNYAYNLKKPMDPSDSNPGTISLNWQNRWFAIISGGVRDFSPDTWGVTWDSDDPQWQYLFRPFFLAIDIESGRNFWEPIAAHTVPNWWPQIPQPHLPESSNYIPYAIANPLVLDVFDNNGQLVTQPGAQKDGYADLIYAGDLNGNLYAIKLYRPNFDEDKLFCVDVHRTKPISSDHLHDDYFRGENQPITVTPVAAFDANKQLRVYFGTGKFDDVTATERDDKSDKESMSFYCMVEDLSPSCEGELVNIRLLNKNIMIPEYSGSNFCTSDSETHKWVTSDGQPDGNECFQCIFDFDKPGERVINSALVAGGIVFVTTFIPSDDPCKAEGTSYIYAFDYMCRPLTYNPFQNSGLNTEWLGLGANTWTPGGLPTNGKAAAIRATLGSGMPSYPVIDSSGKYLLVQTSNAKIHKIRVNLAQKPLFLKGWKEKGE